MSLDPTLFAPLGGFIGGSATALGIWASRRAERARRREGDYLLRQLLVGRKDVPGFEDTPGLDKRLTDQEMRLASVVITTQGMSRELHPNHGTSLKDTVDATHRLAQQAAVDAGKVAKAFDDRETIRRAGEKLLRDRIREHPTMIELNQLLDVLPPPEE